MKLRLLLCALGIALCAEAQSACSTANAAGTYTIAGEGQIYLGAGDSASTTPTASALLGVVYLDSAGGMTGWVSNSVGGMTQDYQLVNGKYSVNGNCTGSVEYQLQWMANGAAVTSTDTAMGDLVVSNTTPRQLHAVTVQGIGGKAVARQVLTQISTSPVPSGSCSIPGVSGTYAAAGDLTIYTVAQAPPTTTATPAAMIVQASIDLAGNVTGMGSGSVGGTASRFAIANGKISVNVDCTGSLMFQAQDPETGTVTDGWFTSNLVIANGSGGLTIYGLVTGTPWGGAGGITTWNRSSSSTQ